MTSLLLVVTFAGLLQISVATAALLILRFRPGRNPSAEAGKALGAAVIMPSKGVPAGFDKALRAHAQGCAAKGSRLLVCVESVEDPGVRFVNTVAREFKSVDLVVAGLAHTSSQQNHNMLAGVAAAGSAATLAFADNDFEPPAHWLETLVGPLSDESVTVSTGYRWIIGSGEPGSQFHVLANMTMVAWFLPLCTALGRGLWGGSFALRRKDFDELGVAERWRTSISDDLTLTAALVAHRKRSRFVPDLLISTEDCIENPRVAFAWFERQILNTKAHGQALWSVVLLGLSLQGMCLLLPALGLFAAGFDRTATFAAPLFQAGALAWGLSFATAVLYQQFGVTRGRMTLTLMAPLLQLGQWAAALRTLFVNEIRWAGISYQFNRAGVVTAIVRPQNPVEGA